MQNDQQEQEEIQAQKREKPKFKIPDPMGPIEMPVRTESVESASSQKPLTESKT